MAKKGHHSRKGGAKIFSSNQPRQKGKVSPQQQPPKPLPKWKVLLHNDDNNTMEHVVKVLVEVAHLSEQDAKLRMKEAHEKNLALIMVTHKELAELKRDQLQSKSLVVTIEPEE